MAVVTAPVSLGKAKSEPLWITYKGQTLTLSQWCQLLGLNYKTVYKRRWRGWPIDRVFSAENFSKRRK